ncbi:MAG: class I SAM-dependent methyltransferase [Bacteroidia bacterium]
MQEVKSCPVCSGEEFRPYLNCEDFTVSHELFTIVSCQGCGFMFTNPRPSEEEAGNYYKAEEYVSHTNTSKGIVNKLYKLVRNYTLGQKEKLLRDYGKPGNLLDYGAGTGMFLAYAKNHGWSVSGIEVDSEARKIAKELNSIDLHSSYKDLEENNKNIKFDAISLWHVLEHVYKVNETLLWLHNHLNDDGTIFIAVPNYLSYDADCFKEYWAAYDLPRHIYHFCPDTIKHLMIMNGFRYIDQKPMKFDSYYVSLLSNKYKHGSTSMISSFLTGFKSNLKASRDGNYSSLIYIFKKA